MYKRLKCVESARNIDNFYLVFSSLHDCRSDSVRLALVGPLTFLLVPPLFLQFVISLDEHPAHPPPPPPRRRHYMDGRSHR